MTPRASAVRIRDALAVAAARAAAAAIRATGRGGGTTVPGRVALALSPGIIRHLSSRLAKGTIVVTGTNGKTTTARMIAAGLRSSGTPPTHNRGGANLEPGIAAALARDVAPFGHSDHRIGLFEVDEATLPSAVASLRPRVCVFTNLFRDQLDRYGEVATVAAMWRRALATGGGVALILNADDPNVAALGTIPGVTPTYVGVTAPGLGGTSLEHTADARRCPLCGAELRYSRVFYAHLGEYACPGCSFRRPNPDLAISGYHGRGLAGADATLSFAGHDFGCDLHIPGLYNVYNAAIAVATLIVANVLAATAVAAVSAERNVFGRVERFSASGREVVLALIKNPVGADQVLGAISDDAGSGPLVIAINDNLADGTDVSWLWDADFERLAGGDRRIVVAGTRAEDMAARLKYAGIAPERVAVVTDPTVAMDRALDLADPRETVTVLVTYTALLDSRAELTRRGLVAPFWSE
ncbi:MAG: DUF1727 domain-containing protein [Chloroflexota bacterium]|nr:MAG: DUF1727 domain-containing protein [Chloroflexota bacterium]